MKIEILLKIIMTLIFFILLILFIIPIGVGIINVGNVLGGVISALLMTVSLFFGSFRRLAERICEHTIGRAVFFAGSGIFAVGVILALVISGFMLKSMTDKPNDSPSTLVVLGCQIRGNDPSLMLRRRLDTAYDYLSEHEDVKVVVSGGQGDDEITSEADVMRNYLIGRGISPERIFVEDRSRNTQENIRFSKDLIGENGLCNDITIVTDGFHQLRADIFARREGLRAYNLSAPTEFYLLPTYWVREWFGVAYYTVFH